MSINAQSLFAYLQREMGNETLVREMNSFLSSISPPVPQVQEFPLEPKKKDMTGLEKEMEYPYSYVTPLGPSFDYYPLEEILKPILVETPEEKADASGFPQSIQEHFWIRPGENDGDEWIACGQLKNGAYFHYQASCDYTGFDCQGGMRLWVSKSWKNILEHAMDPHIREMYEKAME